MTTLTVGQAPTASASRGTAAARTATGQDFDSVLQGELRGRDSRSARADHADRPASPDHADRPVRPDHADRPVRPDQPGDRDAQAPVDANSAVGPKATPPAATATDTPGSTNIISTRRHRPSRPISPGSNALG